MYVYLLLLNTHSRLNKITYICQGSSLYTTCIINNCRLLHHSAESTGTGFFQLGHLHWLQHVICSWKFRNIIAGITFVLFYTDELVIVSSDLLSPKSAEEYVINFRTVNSNLPKWITRLNGYHLCGPI